MKVLICGYLGGGNCGDEAICDRLTATLHKTGDQPILLSLRPSESALLHRCKALHRISPDAIAALWDCDLFILGGGTLLQEETSRRSAVFYLCLAAAAAIFGKPWVLMGGLDPLSKKTKRLAKAILPTARAFYLRDRDSLRRASALAPAVPGLYLPDSALLPLENSPVFSREIPSFPYIAICPRRGVSAKTIAPIAIKARRKGWRLIFLALSREDETICATLATRFGGVWLSPLSRHTKPQASPIGPCRQIAAETILQNLPPRSAHRYFSALPCEIACRMIAAAKEVYSARLHGLLFAQKADTPAHILSDGTMQWKLRGTFPAIGGVFSKT